MASGVRIRAIGHRTGFKGRVEWSTIDRQVPGSDWKTRVYSFRYLWRRYLVDMFAVTAYGVFALGHSAKWPEAPRVWTSPNGKWWFLNRQATRLVSDGGFRTWMPGAAVRDSDVIVVNRERTRPADPDFSGPRSVPTVWHGTLNPPAPKTGGASVGRA